MTDTPENIKKLQLQIWLSKSPAERLKQAMEDNAATMQKTIATFFFCFILTQSFSQSQRKVAVYLQGQYNQTMYDRTVPNNPWGAGFGVQALYNAASKFKPAFDFTADAYLANDKVLRLNPDGTPIEDISDMINIFIGASYHPSDKTYLSFVAGPSFINGKTLVGIKPSWGVYFSQNKRWTVKASYIHVFNRDKRTNEDFGTLSFSIGVRIF